MLQRNRNNTVSLNSSIPHVLDLEDCMAEKVAGGSITVTCINEEGEGFAASGDPGDSVTFNANNTVALEIGGDVGPDYEIRLTLNSNRNTVTRTFRAAGEDDIFELPEEFENKSISVTVQKAPGSTVTLPSGARDLARRATQFSNFL